MIDPVISLAFSVYSNKGAYALLLGSGVSRASGIPTGWEVVLDLVSKIAKLEDAECEPDPAAWFRTKHGAEPDYSKLLDQIAKAPTERQQLLRSYFEPSDDERAQGLKLPGKAHRAIAQLVAGGYIRVILTTNFDRLIERALDEAGLTPTIISSSDQLAGALPLIHSGVTVVKLHGDYLDSRIKNTESELAGYDKVLDTLLDRIFDEYGLIISGWSGDWDVALRAAIERCPSRRFSTFWTTRSELSGKAKALADQRQAVVLKAKDADQMFEGLREKVLALEDLALPHPLSSRMAIATVKRYLVDATSRIRLRDLVHEETEKLFAEITTPTFGGSTQLQPTEEINKRVEKYQAFSEILLSIVITGCYWGADTSSTLWVNLLKRIANPSDVGGGLVYLIKLRRYPVLLLLYGGGLAAIAAGNYKLLAALLLEAKLKNNQEQDVPLCSKVYPMEVLENQLGQMLPGMDRRRTPLSDYLFDKLREPLREYLPRDEDYADTFDRFEYFLGLVHASIKQSELDGGWWGPVGCFIWRTSDFGQGHGIAHKIVAEIDAEGTEWPPLKAGLFGGSLEKAKLATNKFGIFLSKLPRY